MQAHLTGIHLREKSLQLRKQAQRGDDQYRTPPVIFGSERVRQPIAIFLPGRFEAAFEALAGAPRGCSTRHAVHGAVVARRSPTDLRISMLKTPGPW